MIKNRITKYLIFFFGIICLFIFITVRFEKSPLFLINSDAAWDENFGGYGDLYNLNLLDTFKTKVYEKEASFLKSGNKNDINESEVIFFGDSFLGGSASEKTFYERFEDSLKIKTFFSNDDNPLVYLSKVNFIKKNRKFIILEMVERRIIDYFNSPPKLVIKGESLVDIKKFFFPVLVEQKYNYLLQKSKLTYNIYKIVNEIKFKEFGFINSATPIYSLNPPFLFYFQDVDGKNTSFYYNFSDSEIDRICSNLELYKNLFKEKYNLELIFLPIPNKYTIYHKLINNDKYNNLLPVLYNKLKEKRISVIELYYEFIKTNELLYHSTDTHWNTKGENITLNKLIKYFSEIEK